MRDREDLRSTAIRELAEETQLDGERIHLDQLRVYSAPDRDPRGRVITVAFLAIAPNLPLPIAGTDARRAEWRAVEPLLDGTQKLAFDHQAILTDAVEKACTELEQTTVAAAFCDEKFTITELRRVYECIWGYPLDTRNFHRKVLGTQGFLEATGDYRSTDIGRPAMLYKRGEARILYPPMLRATTSAAAKRSPTG